MSILQCYDKVFNFFIFRHSESFILELHLYHRFIDDIVVTIIVDRGGDMKYILTFSFPL